MKIWLDDIREIPEGYTCYRFEYVGYGGVDLGY